MASRVRTSAALLPAIALVVAPCLAGCSADPAPVAPTPTDVGVVHLPTSAAPTTDSGGHRISGVSQGGGGQSPTFTDQDGSVALDDLKKVG